MTVSTFTGRPYSNYAHSSIKLEFSPCPSLQHETEPKYFVRLG